MIRLLLTIGLVAAVTTPRAGAHEFWIDPPDFILGPGEPVVAHLRVGQNFDGFTNVYNPENFRRFEIGNSAGTSPVDGRLGDSPALDQPVEEGLQVVVHVTKDYRLTYREFAKFEAFVREKDAEWTLDAHRARALPPEDFREAYSRYAKSLVAVGAGQGADKAYGLETELVAGLNPYTDDLAGGLPVTLNYQGAPRQNAQIDVFEKDPDGTVRHATIRTDADGRAIVPVMPGRRYMLDAVVLREPSAELAEREGAVWESLWANLTFAVPEAATEGGQGQ